MKRSGQTVFDHGDECEESGLMWSRPKVHDDRFAMTLIVHKMNGETFDITVDPWTTIAETKGLIQSKTSFLPESQQLLIHSQICADQHRISRYTNLRSTNAFLTIVNPSTSGVSSSSSSGVNPYAAAPPPPEPAQPPAPEPEPIAGDNNQLSEDEAERDLVVLLRDLRRAREAAEAEESESESTSDHESAEEDASNAPELSDIE